MWIVRVALSRPYTFIVLALLILMLSPLVILRTPTDIFPSINIPVIAVAWPARSSLEWYLSMISPAPIPAHRSEASRLQGMGANLALPAHWNLPTQN